MPYIEKEQRLGIDNMVDPLINYLKNVPVEQQDGMINYAVTKLVKNIYPRKYFHYNRALGVLESIKQELYRVVIAPYEDQKIKDNGDV